MSGAPETLTRHGEMTNVLVAFGATVAMVTIMRVIGNATHLDVFIAAPPFMFMAYTALSLVGKKKARRAEDQRDMQSISDLVSQCVKALALIDEAVARATVDYRTYMALNRLAITIRLFISRYGKYLERKGVWAALEAESLVMMAELSEGKSMGEHIEPIRDYIVGIKESVIGIDDPRLEAVR